MIFFKLFSSVKMTTLENNDMYWIGPYKCLIPIEFDYCIAEDGRNWMCPNGFQTFMGVIHKPDKKEWLNTYATFNGENWIYNKTNPHR